MIASAADTLGEALVADVQDDESTAIAIAVTPADDATHGRVVEPSVDAATVILQDHRWR